VSRGRNTLLCPVGIEQEFLATGSRQKQGPVCLELERSAPEDFPFFQLRFSSFWQILHFRHFLLSIFGVFS
jgi:hypothetical protein